MKLEKLQKITEAAYKNPHRHSAAGEESPAFIEFLSRRYFCNIMNSNKSEFSKLV
ncbi:MAG: hypothetical protein JHC31_15270 [Sulfurihydrogenibium sp.]|nr:hypothetical protein [Sulfurihydrogenibium sp.]